MTPKKYIALIVYLLFCTHEIDGASSDSDQEPITISNPLVLLTGTSKYDTIKDLDSVEDEMKALYTLFKTTCGYDVKSTYFDDNGNIIYDDNEVVKNNGEEEKISDDDQNSSRFKGRLSEERLQDFMHDQYNYLYKHRKKYDALIFIFSGHGSGNKKGNDMLLCSNFYTQKNKPKNHVFLAEIQTNFNNYVKDFSGKPKLFFDLACRGGSGGKSLNFKEDKSQYKGVEDTYEEANSVTYYTTTPGKKTDTEVGVKFVQFLSENIEKSLNKTASKNSLHAIMNKVSLKTRKHNGCPDMSGPLSLHADNIFFTSTSTTSFQCLRIIKEHIIHHDIDLIISPKRREDLSRMYDSKERENFENRIKCVSWDDTSSRFASASWDGQIKVWNIQGDGLFTLQKGVMTGCFGKCCWASGSKLLCANSDRAVNIWNANNGSDKHILKNDKLGRGGLDWSERRAYLACGDTGYACIYDLTKRTCVTSFKLPHYFANTEVIKWCGDDHKRVAIAGTYGVEIWDIDSCQKLVTFRRSNISDIACSADNRYIASADWDDGTKVWDMRQRKLLTSLGNKAACGVCWSRNNKHLVTSGGYGRSGYIKMYDAHNFKLIKTLDAYNAVESVDLSPNCQYMASGHYWGVVKLWKK